MVIFAATYIFAKVSSTQFKNNNNNFLCLFLWLRNSQGTHLDGSGSRFPIKSQSRCHWLRLKTWTDASKQFLDSMTLYGTSNSPKIPWKKWFWFLFGWLVGWFFLFCFVLFCFVFPLRRAAAGVENLAWSLSLQTHMSFFWCFSTALLWPSLILFQC